MTNVLILGANGQLARNTIRVFLRDTDARLTLYLRRASRLPDPDPKRVTIVEGDVLDRTRLEAAMEGQDVVYANLSGPISYQLTQKGQPFKGHDVSLNSLSDPIVKLALTPGMESRHSIGVSRG